MIIASTTRWGFIVEWSQEGWCLAQHWRSAYCQPLRNKLARTSLWTSLGESVANAHWRAYLSSLVCARAFNCLEHLVFVFVLTMIYSSRMLYWFEVGCSKADSKIEQLESHRCEAIWAFGAYSPPTVHKKPWQMECSWWLDWENWKRYMVGSSELDWWIPLVSRSIWSPSLKLYIENIFSSTRLSLGWVEDHRPSSWNKQDDPALYKFGQSFEDQLLSVLLEARSRRYGLGECHVESFRSRSRCICEVNIGESETQLGAGGNPFGCFQK